MSKTRKGIKNNNGFTLVELMVTVLLTAIAVVSIYRGYSSFSQAADAQQQVMEMQQNLRIGMARLSADIRRAGMNEEYVSKAGFIRANNEYIEFSMDLSNGGVFKDDNTDNDDDGDKDDGITTNNTILLDPEALEEDRIGDGDVDNEGEKIKYDLYDEPDTDGDGVLDVAEDLNGNGVREEGHLRRYVSQAGGTYPVTPQTIITNVEALDFVYWDAESAGPPPEPAEELNLFTKEDPAGFFGLENVDL
jgi:prepilin-type N-terminal cleavage/methylation domain-containing protein